MKKYIIEIKLKKEEFARYYYNITRESFELSDDKFWINYTRFFDFKNIDYLRIIEQGE